MNNISEFTIIEYGSNGKQANTTWRWLPRDPRAQHLYADGALTDDLRKEFEEIANRAQLWLRESDRTAFDEEVEGSRRATPEEALTILDGWVFMGRVDSGIYPFPDQDAPDYWAAHAHQTVDGVKVVSQEESALSAAQIEAQAEYDALTNPEYLAVIAEAGKRYDEKATRYKKLGWDDADIEAEFGPRPEAPKAPATPKRAKGHKH